MNEKKTVSITMLLLLVFSALSLLRFNVTKVSAAPESPYIMVRPETTLNSAYNVGSNYSISVYTNYNVTFGNDAWAWQFQLTFNPSILEGLEVRNGDLIVNKTGSPRIARFSPGTFNNTKGELSLPRAFFEHVGTKYTTTGPGILANVTFRVKGYGFSYVDISDAVVDPPAILNGYNMPAEGGYYEIINGMLYPEQLGHGYFRNGLTGDANLDKTVNVFDILAVKSRWGRTPDSPDWIREYDVNDDGAINVFDILTVKANWGQTIP